MNSFYGGDIDAMLESIPRMFEDLLSSGFIWVAVLAIAFVVLVALVLWAIESFAIYKIVRKTDRMYPWLIWLSIIPFVGGYIKWYVLSDIPGEKPYALFNEKIKTDKRLYAFFVWAAIALAGGFVVWVIGIGLGFFMAIPIIGLLFVAVKFVVDRIPAIATGIIEYGFLRDILNMFKADKKNNMITAIVVTVLDKLILGGIARMIILLTLIKKDILPEEVEVVENVVDDVTVTNETPVEEVQLPAEDVQAPAEENTEA